MSNYYRDLREYLAALEASGKLFRIKREINKDTELYPLARLQYRGLPIEERGAFLFENVTDSNGKKYGIPVALGLLASSVGIYALGLKCRPDEIQEKLAAAEARPLPPVMVESGPVQEEVHIGDGLLEHGGLSEFPVPVTTPGFDPAPYITAPCFVSKDPDSGIPNAGMYRAMLKSPVRTGLNFATPGKGGYLHLQKYRKLGKPMPAAIAIGGPPSINYAAVSPLPADFSEFGYAGGIAGEPLELVKCKTVDLEVPARAEIVIEGEVPPGELEPEAPFGETYGFVCAEELNPWFQVKCITHRRNPIYMAAATQYPPNEETTTRAFAYQGAVYRRLRQELGMDFVREVSFFEEAIGVRMMAIRMEKAPPDGVWRALEAAAKRVPLAKLLVAVDSDINVRDLGSVVLAIANRSQPHRDFRVEKYPAPSVTDYSVEPLGPEPWQKFKKLEKRQAGINVAEVSRVLIDATAKWPLPPLSLPAREYMERARDIWQEAGLPALRLREPWWGVNLGFWNEDHERHARAAVCGDYYQAGGEYEKRRVKE